MRRFVALTAVAFTGVLSLAACGGGSAPQQAAGGGAAAAGGAAGVQITAMNTGAAVGADGDMAKIPQGMSLAKAEAAGLGKDGAPVISVNATDTSCTPDVATVKAGKVWFKVTNQGGKITEMYLESPDAKQLKEVEKVGAGKSGAFMANVTAGGYMIACEPGMADKQIRTPITVQ